jgi:hypothetical protein
MFSTGHLKNKVASHFRQILQILLYFQTGLRFRAYPAAIASSAV